MSKYFSFDIGNEEWMPQLDKVPFEDEKYDFRGSYHLIASRLMGISYPDYLKYCYCEGGAEIRGGFYLYPVFKNKKQCDILCGYLNTQLRKCGLV